MSQPLMAYRSLLDNAHMMLQAAKEERWDDLSLLDADRQSCLSLVTSLGDSIQSDEGRREADCGSGEAESLRLSERQACTELIKAILEIDLQTSVLIKARKKELVSLLGSVDKERKLANFYRNE